MNRTITFICSCLLLGCVYAQTPYKDCGSESGALVNVVVGGCSPPTCIFHRNTNETVKVAFTTKKEISKVGAVVHGIIDGLPVPFPIQQSDGCQNSGLTCPLASGGSFSYNTAIFVSPKYPELRLIVKWELRDQDNKDIVCFEVPAEIKD